MPRIVLDELRRARPRVIKAAERSSASHFQEVRCAIDKVGDDKRKQTSALKFLADAQHKLPQIGRPAETTLDEIEEILTKAGIVEASDAVMRRVADRAPHRKAPCHRPVGSLRVGHDQWEAVCHPMDAWR